MRVFVCLLTALAAFGCTTPGDLVERRWIEVRSANFSVYTTLPEPDARKLLGDLELFRATVSLISNVEKQDSPVPTEIYAFNSIGDFAPFRGDRNVVGFFQAGLRSNRVALTTSSGIDANAVMYHEYTHFLIRNQNRLLYPAWFDEGFAELLGSVLIRDEWIEVGTVPKHRRSSFAYLEAMPYSRLIRTDDFSSWPDEDQAMFYAQSWLLVHYLIYGDPAENAKFPSRMARYILLLEQGKTEEAAFSEAFGMSFGELQRRLQKYTRIPTYRFPRSEIDADVASQVRPVSRDEIGVRLGWLALSTGQLDLAQSLFTEAVTTNASNSRAHAGIGDTHKFAGRFEEAATAYRQALSLDGQNWENHLEYGEYFLDRARREEPSRATHLKRAREELHRVIELAPANPEGHAMLGITYLVEEREPELGIEALERAERMLPSNPDIHYPLALLHYRAGNRDRASDLLRRVIHWSHSAAASEEALRLLQELDEGRSEGVDD